MQPFPTAELGKALGGSEPPAAPPSARAGQVQGAESCSASPRPSSPLPGVWGDSPPPPPPHLSPGFPAVKTALLALSYSLFNTARQNKWAQPRRSHWRIPLAEESREQPLLPIPPSGRRLLLPRCPPGPALGAGRAVFLGPGGFCFRGGGTRPEKGACFPASRVALGAEAARSHALLSPSPRPCSAQPPGLH